MNLVLPSILITVRRKVEELLYQSSLTSSFSQCPFTATQCAQHAVKYEEQKQLPKELTMQGEEVRNTELHLMNATPS